MGVSLWLTQYFCQSLSHPRRRGVLQAVSFFVDLVPRETQDVGQKELPETVATQEPERLSLSCIGQDHTVVRFVLDQTVPV
jgi:hypothetical protein